MSPIERVEILQVDLLPKVVRTDAIQSFVKQETPMVRITCADGAQGAGYTYTIGTGGSSVLALLRDHLAPLLVGATPTRSRRCGSDLFFSTHATAVGAITSLALAAIDTALWDLRCRRAGLPLWQAAGGAQRAVPVYTTEGGWLHLPIEQLVEETVAAKAAGFRGAKIKVGRPHDRRGRRAARAVREAVGPDFEIMVDANQASPWPRRSAARGTSRRCDLAWFEEPLPAEDLGGHAGSQRAPAADRGGRVDLLDPHFREYLQRDACSIVQADFARIGGITPWLKVAHLAETFNVAVCPHFLMELHVSLSAAVPNARWVEYIPQLDAITTSRLEIGDGFAIPPKTPGLGIDWDWAAIDGWPSPAPRPGPDPSNRRPTRRHPRRPAQPPNPRREPLRCRPPFPPPSACTRRTTS